MPPKAAPKKEENIDLSEIGTLPKAKTATMQIAFSKFKTTEARTKIQEHVLGNLPEERVKKITRQDITDYGKSKGIIVDSAPEGDTRTPDEMMAQAASDRLFELQFAVRKAKKDKLTKLEEDAAAKAAEAGTTAEKVETDLEILDALIYLPDYPTTQKEFLAFSKYGHTVNCHFEIYQVMENVDGTAPVDLKAAKDVAVSEEPEELAHFNSFMESMASIKSSISASSRTAPVRHCALFRVPYLDQEIPEFTQNEDGERTTNILTSEQAFMKTFFTENIEKFGAFYINYVKFREQVELHQLYPDRAVMEELSELKRAHVQYEQWKADREESKRAAAQALTDQQKEGLSQEQLDEQEKAKQDSAEAIESEIDTQKQKDNANQDRILELLQKSKRSLDEEKTAASFSDKIYKKDFIPDKESTNSVPSIMSAMISQIAIENSNLAETVRDEDASTEPETLDDIFDTYKMEIAIQTNLMEREIEEEQYVQKPLKGILPTDINVYETYDTSTKCIQTLPANMVEERKEHAMKISEREKSAAKNLVLPGCNRFMMPDVPSKSLRLRNFENPQFYPFSTLPIEDAERTMQLKAFQQLIKSNNIDEGVKQHQRLAKNKIFERKYDEYFEEDVLRQVLQESMLQDPDIASMYYPRTDEILLVLHNKINNSKRTSDNKESPHGMKKWRSAYRVMPDFQTWIEFFGHNSVIQHTEYEAKDPSDPPVKFTLDEEMIPYQMLDIDDHRVTSLNQTLNQFFPDDNSILTSEEYQIGGVNRTKSIVYKDKMTFGLKELKKEAFLPVPEQHGLVSYKSIGDHQLWVNFSDKESKLLVETVEAIRNPQMQIEIKAAEPTAEEIAAKEEAAKAAAEAAKKAKGKGPAVVEEVEEQVQQVKYESAPPNYLDSLFNDEDLLPTKGPCTTLTMKNGLIVRHLPNGNIIQIKDSSLENPGPDTEVDRIHLKDGVVVRHFHNLDSEVLWPNGEIAKFSRQEMKWTVTNDMGFRREMKDGLSKDLPKVNCLIQTDQKTGIVTKVREDNVVLIIYEDGNTYCQHADGTQIFSEDELQDKDKKRTRVEKDGFAPIMYQPTAWGEDFDDWLDTEELKSRDGQMILAYLPDGCVVKTIQFYKNSGTDRLVMRHFFQRQDFSCFIIDEDGDFRILSTEARAAINDDDERSRLGTDSDYLKVMYQPNGIYTAGVYYGNISDVQEKVHIITRDFDKPFCYKINSINKLEKLNYEDWEKDNQFDDNTNYREFEPERDIERINCQRNPYIRSFIYPRMFVINPQGQGFELLAQDQVDKIIRFTLHKEDTLTTSRVEYVDNTQMNSIQVINKVSSIQETQLKNQKMDKLSFPEYAFPYIIPRKTEEELKMMMPIQDQYQYRNIAEYSSFELLKQNAFIEDYMRFNEWIQSQVRYNSEFGITHVAPRDGSLDLDEIEDNEFYAKRINTKIYNERATMKEALNRSVFKSNFQKAFNRADDIVGFRKRMTTVEKEEEEIKQEIEKRKKEDVKRQLDQEKAEKEGQLSAWRDKKKIKTKTMVESRLKEYNDKKETPIFASQYKTSRQGVEYYRANPVKPPSDEVIMRMTQRIQRSQHKPESMFDGQSQDRVQENNQLNEDKDNPIVALEPEEHLKQASIERSKKLSASKHTQDGDMDATGMPLGEGGPSLYHQEKSYLKQLEQEKILKAEEHHVIKTKDFDVYGKLRQEQPFVKATAKSKVATELNEKFITTECITDRRIRISSMANRQYMNAPTVEDVRKQGQHQMILQAIDKKQTFSELINQANSMVTSVLHDQLKRSVNILPSKCVFGSVCQGQDAEMIFTIKNEDSLSQRVQIKPVQDKRLVVRQETYGPIAPGMTKRIIVTIKATEEDSLGKIKEEIQVMTKSDVFKVPVEALILSVEGFAKEEETALGETGKSITNSRVKNRLRSSIADGRKNSVIATFKAQQEAEEEQLQQYQQQQLTSKEGGDDMEGSDQQQYDDMDMN